VAVHTVQLLADRFFLPAAMSLVAARMVAVAPLVARCAPSPHTLPPTRSPVRRLGAAVVLRSACTRLVAAAEAERRARRQAARCSQPRIGTWPMCAPVYPPPDWRLSGWKCCRGGDAAAAAAALGAEPPSGTVTQRLQQVWQSPSPPPSGTVTQRLQQVWQSPSPPPSGTVTQRLQQVWQSPSAYAGAVGRSREMAERFPQSTPSEALHSTAEVVALLQGGNLPTEVRSLSHPIRRRFVFFRDWAR
jgi:hypothetical protein